MVHPKSIESACVSGGGVSVRLAESGGSKQSEALFGTKHAEMHARRNRLAQKVPKCTILFRISARSDIEDSAELGKRNLDL